MNILIDTHTFLLFVSGSIQLPISLRNKIKDTKTTCYISTASLWEIVVKLSLGKLELDITLQELFDYIERNQIQVLEINFNHFLELSSLPHFHKDPFDRLIISQALVENFPIATKDKLFKQYKIKTLWN